MGRSIVHTMTHIDWLVLVERYTAHFELYYSKTLDWRLRIWKRGCAEDGSDLEICDIQHPDVNYVLAKGEVLFKEWLTENSGGY